MTKRPSQVKPTRKIPFTVRDSRVSVNKLYARFPKDGTYAELFSYSAEEYEKISGGPETIATITEISRDQYIIEADQYYSSNGVLKLEITKSLDRAIETFAAMLQIDSALEDAE